MKIKERLAYMALGGVFVIAGMILGQFMFSSVNAQSPDRDSIRADTISCDYLYVHELLTIKSFKAELDGKGERSVEISPKGIDLKDINDKPSLSIDSYYGPGRIRIFSGKLKAEYSESGESVGRTYLHSLEIVPTDNGSATIRIYNQHNEKIVSIGPSTGNDGLITLKDRYGDVSEKLPGKVR